MSTIKISSKVEEQTWNDLKLMAKDTSQNISGLLTIAIREYLQRSRIRPEVLTHLNDSIIEHKELGEKLAR